MQPQRCPICDGRGLKPADFYRFDGARDKTPVQCRSCYGRGILWNHNWTESPSGPWGYPTITWGGGTASISSSGWWARGSGGTLTLKGNLTNDQPFSQSNAVAATPGALGGNGNG